MEETKNKRIEWIDYVRAFACFLVALCHLIQSLQKANIDNHYVLTNRLNWFIYLFHMPLFMCVSGFLYCKKKEQVTLKNYKNFVIKKVINLSIPYFTFYLVYLLLNIIFSSSVNTPKGINEFIGMFNKPISPFWFLYALLSIFIIIPIVEKIFKNNKKSVMIFLFILKIISIFWKCNIYFVYAIMTYAIYFYFGIFITEEVKKDKNSSKKMIGLAIIYTITARIYTKYIGGIPPIIISLLDIIFALAGILICINCFKVFEKHRFLDTFKKYTFQIYLTHTIFAAGVRIVLLKMNVTSYLIHFILGMAASIYIPVLIGIISDKIKYTNIFFFPIKTIEEIKERKDEKCQAKS